MASLRIRLSTNELENIQDALRVLCESKPARARPALAALVQFQSANGGKHFDITLANLEIACEALASRYQKTTGAHRASIDEAIEKLSTLLLNPDFALDASSTAELDFFKDFLINRRPVCDAHMEVHLYEPDTCCVSATSAAAAAEPNSPHFVRRTLNLVEENLDDLAGHCKVLVTLPYDSVKSGEYKRFSRDRVILGIPDSEGEQLTLQSLAKLYAEGYRMALPESSPRLASIVHLASIVRMNLAEVPREQLVERVRKARSNNAKLLASGVNSPSDFQLCTSMKFDLFEGHFFSSPDTKVRDVPLTTLSTVRLLAALQQPDVRLQELEEIIKQSLPLSYKLLRFLNSAYVGLPRAVLSIRHAVGLAGMRRIQQWASLLLFSSIEDKPRELFITAAIRARMCERLADSDDELRRSTFFTVGLLSVLDAVLDVSIHEAVATLSLSDEICEALIRKIGPIGSVLQAVIAYERSNWDNVALKRIPANTLREAYLDALRWSTSEASVIAEQADATAAS